MNGTKDNELYVEFKNSNMKIVNGQRKKANNNKKKSLAKYFTHNHLDLS